MAATYEDLRTHVNAGVSDDAVLERCWNNAVLLVNKFVGSNVVPAPVLEEAYLVVGAELAERTLAPQPVAGYENPSVPLRITRDPLNPAHAILRPWMVPFS